MGFLEADTLLWKEVEAVARDEDSEISIYDLDLVSGRLFVSICREADLVAYERPESSGGDADTGVTPRQGVTTGDCAKLCKRLSLFLEVEAERLGVPADLQLEVSSPGINRELRRDEHFAFALGQRAKISWVDSDGGSRKTSTVTGLLKSATGELVEVEDETGGDLVAIERTAIKKARIDFAF